MAGRKPFEPTEKDRGRVEALSAYGIEQGLICKLIINPTTGKSIDEKTLRAHFRDELDRGQLEVFEKLGQSLVEQAVGAPAVYDENKNLVRAEQKRVPVIGMFLAKTRMGYRETDRVELTGKNGGDITIKVVKYSGG